MDRASEGGERAHQVNMGCDRLKRGPDLVCSGTRCV